MKKTLQDPVNPELLEAERLLEQPDTVVGYQYSPQTQVFIGEYSFPNNKDKLEIHLPPHTTLTPPPAIPEGQAAYWREGQWVLDAAPLSGIFKPEEPLDPRTVKVPVFKRVMRQKPAQPDKPNDPPEFEETVEIEQETITVEQVQERAASMRDLFEAQQRAWGLMK